MFPEVISFLVSSSLESVVEIFKEKKNKKKLENKFEELESEIVKKYGGYECYSDVINDIMKRKDFLKITESSQSGDITYNSNIFLSFIDDYKKENIKNIKRYNLYKDIITFYHDNSLSIITSFTLTPESKAVINQNARGNEKICQHIDSKFDEFAKNSQNKKTNKEINYASIKEEIDIISDDNIEKIFIINNTGSSSFSDLFTLSSLISERFFNISTYDKKKKIESPVPYIFFKDLELDTYKKLLNKLYDKDLILIDGFPFSESKFRVKQLTQSTKTTSTFNLKIIKNKEVFDHVIDFFIDDDISFYLIDLFDPNSDFYDSNATKLYKYSNINIRDFNKYILNV